MKQTISGSLQVGGAGGGDVVVDISGSPFGAGFKFNTLPLSGMTIEGGYAVKLQSYAEVILAPADGKAAILRTTGTRPAASESLRGALFVVRGAAGVADTLQVCLKTDTDTYGWKTVTTT